MGDTDNDTPTGSESSPLSPVVARARLKGVYAPTREALARVEEWLACGKTPRQAAELAESQLDVARDTANRYVATVLHRLHEDGAHEPQESKRARIIGMLHAQIDRALSNQRMSEHDGATIWYKSPDLKAANQAIQLLAVIEGVMKPGS